MIRLYTDGGGTKDSSGAGAFILDCESAAKGIIFLGPATNNEAEIAAGLAGFAKFKESRTGAKFSKAASEVTWVSDSSYSLKSATGYIVNWQKNGWKTADKKPVKNKGLWQVFLELSRGLEISPEHVKGHSGHPENEACDEAATWGQTSGGAIFSEGEGASLENSGPDSDWFVYDGRKFLDLARQGEHVSAFSELLRLVGCDESRIESLLPQGLHVKERSDLKDEDEEVKVYKQSELGLGLADTNTSSRTGADFDVTKILKKTADLKTDLEKSPKAREALALLKKLELLIKK